MIQSIRHKGLLKLFKDGSRRAVPTKLAPRLLRILDRLDACGKAEDMDIPGFRFHPLKGMRQGTYAVNASANWRVTFRFQGPDVYDVDLEDYH